MARTTKTQSKTTTKNANTNPKETNMARTTAKKSTSRKATPKVETKVCTKSGIELPATAEFFYRDKSQKDGLSPWSKEAEREYNAAYRKGLSDAKAARKADIPTTDRAGKTRLTKFEKAMAPERVARGRAAKKNAKASA